LAKFYKHVPITLYDNGTNIPGTNHPGTNSPKTDELYDYFNRKLIQMGD